MMMVMHSKRQKGQCLCIKKRELKEIEEMKKKKARVDIWLKHQMKFAWKQKPQTK